MPVNTPSACINSLTGIYSTESDLQNGYGVIKKPVPLLYSPASVKSIRRMINFRKRFSQPAMPSGISPVSFFAFPLNFRGNILLSQENSILISHHSTSNEIKNENQTHAKPSENQGNLFNFSFPDICFMQK